MRNYETRLKLIQAKCQLILNESSNSRGFNQNIKNALTEIINEAKKAYDEIDNDNGWEAGDR